MIWIVCLNSIGSVPLGIWRTAPEMESCIAVSAAEDMTLRGSVNVSTSILSKTLYPVVKSPGTYATLHAPFMVCKTTGTAFHKQSELLICGNTCCSHNPASQNKVKCLHSEFLAILSRVKRSHFLFTLWSQVNDMSRRGDILRLRCDQHTHISRNQEKP